MKKLTLFIILTFLISVLATSQSCLPDGIFLTTQSQIDSSEKSYNIAKNRGEILKTYGIRILIYENHVHDKLRYLLEQKTYQCFH